MRFVSSGLVALLMGTVGCGGGKLINQSDASGAGGIGGSGFGRPYETTVSRAVDILFLIDDSSGMLRAQTILRRDFPTFITTLQSGPDGMPDLHIGVITSDMGAGDGTLAACNATGGKRGILQPPPPATSPAAVLCTVELQAGARYVADNGGGVRNYTGGIAEAFRCVAAVSETGCGFEHQFAAILRALGADGRPAPVENQGFLRPDASLVIVMLTDEDDCSATPGVPLFDVASNMTLFSQLGPSLQFRCNEFGHVCNGQHPSRIAPNNDVAATMTYSGCTSNDSEGYLLGVVDTANRIKALKMDPAKILVASISGPATPYVVRWRPPSTADTSCGAASCPWPEIGHACSFVDSSADPAVRVTELVSQFGARGLVLPICADSYAPSLQRVGEGVNALLEPGCISGQLADDPAKAGLQPDCIVIAHAPQPNGTVVDSTVPSCADADPPCWTFTRDRPSCQGDAAVVYSPAPGSPPEIKSVTVKCSLCVPGESDPNRCI